MSLVPSEIVNMALSALGSDLSVVNFDKDTSNEAKCARVFYGQAVREVLEDFPWPFACVQEKLALAEWFYSAERRFAYLYPSNCVIIRRLFSTFGQNRNDDAQSRLKYKIVHAPAPDSGLPNMLLPPPPLSVPALPPPPPFPPRLPFQQPPQGVQMVKLILADFPELLVEYTGDDMVVSDYSPYFKRALSYKLAAYMAPRLTGGDPYKLADRSMAMYVQAIATAATHAGNEEVDDLTRAGEFIDQRGGPLEGGHMGAFGWRAYPSSSNVENF